MHSIASVDVGLVSLAPSEGDADISLEHAELELAAGQVTLSATMAGVVDLSTSDAAVVTLGEA